MAKMESDINKKTEKEECHLDCVSPEVSKTELEESSVSDI